MGIRTRTGNTTAYGNYDSTRRCFYCSTALSGEATLLWIGSAGDLELHPGCFLDMTTRLFRDLHAIQLGTDYHVLKNASPKLRPDPAEMPQGREGRTDFWARWRILMDARRDKTVVRQ